jgi:hypothetical protein
MWNQSGNPPFASSIWETVVEHSLRPDMTDGILLLYQQLIPLLDEGADISKALAWAPEGRVAEFSYVTEHLSDDAELIIAELVGNAVRHGLRAAPQIRRVGASPSALRLCLLRRVGEVMLAVTDPSDDVPQPKAPSDSGESGRGLQIVGALSYVWGWSPIEGSGKAVWAVLRC